MKEVTRYQQFVIYRSDDCFILHNSEMEGFKHSHIKNLKTAIWIADLSIRKKIPHDLPYYLLVSLLRVNDDPEYCRKLEDLIAAKEKRKDLYFNSNKGVRKKR